MNRSTVLQFFSSGHCGDIAKDANHSQEKSPHGRAVQNVFVGPLDGHVIHMSLIYHLFGMVLAKTKRSRHFWARTVLTAGIPLWLPFFSTIFWSKNTSSCAQQNAPAEPKNHVGDGPRLGPVGDDPGDLLPRGLTVGHCL